jgi:hypothetical protein
VCGDLIIPYHFQIFQWAAPFIHTSGTIHICGQQKHHEDLYKHLKNKEREAGKTVEGKHKESQGGEVTGTLFGEEK